MSEAVDAFILFNEKEDSVPDLVDMLSARGITTYFWRRDIPFGTSWIEVEEQRLREAKAVLVILGSHGWGPTHLQITRKALALGKRILPVLIGDPPAGALKEADGLFVKFRYVDLRNRSTLPFDLLRDLMVGPGAASRATSPAPFDAIVSSLVDGDEGARARTLRLVRTLTVVERPALAGRLAFEVRERFSPDPARSFATASRDPTLIPSIRSWMLTALAWADARHEHRDLLLAHLSPGYEPEAVVRFRVLAALYQAEVPYLDEALHRPGDDPAGEVRALALAIQSPQHAVEAFRSALRSDDFQRDVWPALRVLRMVALPQLVPDVRGVLVQSERGSLAEYDALYALTNPGMATAAAQLLRSGDETAYIVDRVISASRQSNENAIRNFSGLLATMDSGPVDGALAAARRDPATAGLAATVERFLAELRRQPDDGDLAVAGYNADVIDVSEDPLGIQEDVQTLTAVVMARQVTPPLAVGLFGDWGAGKSWFMQSVRATADALAAESLRTGDDTFCTHIVSIEFNAWHYADTHLLPSLVYHILEKLSAHVSTKLTPEQEQAALVSARDDAQTKAASAEAIVAAKQQEIEGLQAQVQALRHERETTEIRFQDLRKEHLQELLAQDAGLKQAVDEALEAAGFRGAAASVESLSAAASEANSLREWILSTADVKNRKVVLALMAFVLVVIPLAAIGIRAATDSPFLAVVSAAVAEVAAMAGATAVALRRAAQQVRDRLAPIQKAKLRVEEALEKSRRTPSAREQKLTERAAGLEKERAEAAARLEAETKRLKQVEADLATLEQSRSLAQFLLEAGHSYREHLGVISTIRGHFESLGDHLARAAKEQGTKGKRVDRIILYIDDLDRCPADKVLEVLEAVHLLLAYPLFVVIVGVDPRWLLNSLSDTYSAFQDGGRRAGDMTGRWTITPQNYLEKIFQIPFTLRPMTDTGYEKLVDRLLAPAAAVAIGGGTERTDVRTNGGTDGGAPAGRSNRSVDNVTAQQRPADSSGQAGEQQEPRTQAGQPAGSEARRFKVQKEALAIQSWETEFAKRLFSLMPTPRAVKRFTNIYRMLKAAVGRERLPAFEGTAHSPGEFQVPMLLLALSIGAPAEAAALFPWLRSRAVAGDGLAAALKHLASHDTLRPHVTAVVEKIGLLLDDQRFPDSAHVLREWVPRVARFSFDLGRADAIATVPEPTGPGGPSQQAREDAAVPASH
jgi:hypothetical protein